MAWFTTTEHSRTRMAQRGISEDMVHKVFEYGREVFTNGAIHMVIGRREVVFHMARGIDLRQVEGLHILCPTRRYGLVVTAYRNRNLRGVKSNMGKGRHTPAKVLCHRRERLERRRQKSLDDSA